MKTSTRYLKFFLSLFGTILLITLGTYIGWKLLIFFLPFVIGWIVAMIANPLVRFLEDRVRMLRKHSSILIIILVLGAIIGLGYLAIDKLIEQIMLLIEQAPELYQAFGSDFHKVGENLSGVVSRLPEDVRTNLYGITNTISTSLGEMVKNISQPTVSAAGKAVKYLPTLFVMIIFTILSAYFFVVDRDVILGWGRVHTPKVIRDKWTMVTDSFKSAFGGYFKAQLKIMVVVYVILLVGLMIMGTEFAPLVAFLIAFLDMLPFFGTGTALIPWAVFKFLAGDTKDAIILLVIYAISQIMHQVLQPKLVGDSVGINPLYALFLMYIGFKFKGVLGIIIAIPIGMIIMNFYRAGVFDGLISGFKMMVHDAYAFMKNEDSDTEKLPKKDLPQEKK